LVYDASGAKLKKSLKDNAGVVKETWDYVNGVEYKNRILQRVPHSEGAVVLNEKGAYQQEFVLRDHLGNTRVTFRDGVNLGDPYYDWNQGWPPPKVDPNAKNPTYNDGIITQDDIVQINQYYPFGLAMEGDWNGFGNANNNKYLYNGKQYNDDFGLGWYDYGARWYDPSIARWGAVDPLSEMYGRWSQYNYTLNNPIKFIDPDGQSVESTDVRKNKDGTYTVVNAYDDKDNKVYVVDDKGKRTGGVIAQTLTPIDFMSTNDSNGKLLFDAAQSGVTFNLNKLTLSGTLTDPDNGKCHDFKGADASSLIALLSKVFKDELKNSDTYWSALNKLKDMSGNSKVLDIKASANMPLYTAVRVSGVDSDIPAITTLRAIGNIAFGLNARDLKPDGIPKQNFYIALMQRAGSYNQSQNGGNGYNKGWPFFGEHRYSGTFIYFGYWQQYPKK
jgi:RHS repeat-associated protein